MQHSDIQINISIIRCFLAMQTVGLQNPTLCNWMWRHQNSTSAKSFRLHKHQRLSQDQLCDESETFPAVWCSRVQRRIAPLRPWFQTHMRTSCCVWHPAMLCLQSLKWQLRFQTIACYEMPAKIPDYCMLWNAVFSLHT